MKVINTVQPSARMRLFTRFNEHLNKVFSAFGLPLEVRKKADIYIDMITLEQINNLILLAEQVIFYNVPGDLVELGCHKGKSAMHVQWIIQKYESDKKLYVYDKFNQSYDPEQHIKETLIYNFKSADLTLPVIVEGFFSETLPFSLPEKICFMHIDCGSGGDSKIHKETVSFCLEQTYNRLSPGGICLLMDYHDPAKTIRGYNSNPGVKMACDEFFINKPEKVEVLYGNEFSHGYFRKHNA
jgi:O-methyltransferase